MKTLQLASWVLTAGLACALAPTALAMPPGAPPDGALIAPAALADRPPPYLRNLHLTDAQEDQVFDILHEAAPALRSKEKDFHRAQRQLHDLAMSAGYDAAKAKALAEVAAQAMAEVEALRAGLDNRIYRLLTAEQRTQLAGPPDDDHCDRPPHR